MVQLEDTLRGFSSAATLALLSFAAILVLKLRSWHRNVDKLHRLYLALLLAYILGAIFLALNLYPVIRYLGLGLRPWTYVQLFFIRLSLWAMEAVLLLSTYAIMVKIRRLHPCSSLIAAIASWGIGLFLSIVLLILFAYEVSFSVANWLMLALAVAVTLAMLGLLILGSIGLGEEPTRGRQRSGSGSGANSERVILRHYLKGNWLLWITVQLPYTLLFILSLTPDYYHVNTWVELFIDLFCAVALALITIWTEWKCRRESQPMPIHSPAMLWVAPK